MCVCACVRRLGEKKQGGKDRNRHLEAVAQDLNGHAQVEVVGLKVLGHQLRGGVLAGARPPQEHATFEARVPVCGWMNSKGYC